MLRNRLLLLLALLLPAVACDNVGRAFDRNVDPNTPGNETGESEIQVVPVGGDARDGRPQVREVYPQGSGWPTTVPIVVEFSESINEASVLPTSANGIDGRIGVRVQGSTQLLPAQYDFLANGKLLIIRPLNGLSNEGLPIYEIVLFPDARDVDGVRFQVTGGETVLGDFQVNQGESIDDGAIVAVFPRDNFGDHPRENDFFVIFDKPANASTLDAANLFLQPEGGTPITTEIRTPLATIGVNDPRVVQIEPSATLMASQRYEFTVTENITFGQNGNLDFNGRTPFSEFDTVAPARPTLVELDSPQAGFPNKINATNVATVQIAVTPPADALPGDTVIARIYGGDAETTPTFDEAFVERTGTVVTAGTPVVIDFSGTLGTAASPRLDGGEVTFAAQLQRGSERSGFAQNDANADPEFDVTPPTLVSAGPPGTGNDIYTDGEWLAYYGVASEELAAATIDDGVSPTANIFGSSAGGRFLMLPLPLGRLTANRTYTLTLTDASGNTNATTFSGQVVQQGVLTGGLAGTLTVEVFDHTTLQPVAGATVLVDPATPAVPATGQLLGTTDQAGTATFTTGLSSHTITVIRPGYDLITIVDTQAANVSLPLTPTAEPTASLTGNLAFEQAAGLTAIVGSTAVADRDPMGVRTTNASPTAIPATPITPNRAQILTAFGGGFEPTATPTYTISGCQVCGATLTDPTAPPAPAEAGESSIANFVLIPVPPVVSPNPPTDPTLLGPHMEDFGLAAGLDTSNLVGGLPRARTTMSLQGFVGQALSGVGVVTLNAGTVYDVDANYSLPIITGLAGYSPVSWLVSEAEDTSGNVARTRVLLNPATQTIITGTGPIPIPTVTAGTFSNPPAVTFVDVVDASTVLTGIGCTDLTITDPNGRRWTVLVTDRDDTTGANVVQLPDVAASPNAGLAVGAWSTVAESRVFVSITGSTTDDLVLTERFRQEVNYSRSAAATLTVN
jgi:hypothetical protein